MFIGHYALAFAGKKFAPKTSLGASTLAVSFVDLLWPVFLLLGWETVVIRPGLMKLSPFDFTYYPITHSLLGTAAWSTLLGCTYFSLTRYGRGALWMFFASLSHWFLDVIVHRSDLQIFPGNPLRIGLGLWDQPAIALPLEAVLFTAGVYVYWRSAKIAGVKPRTNFWIFVAFLPVAYAAAIFGTSSLSAPTLAWTALAVWLLPLWAWKVDRPAPL